MDLDKIMNIRFEWKNIPLILSELSHLDQVRFSIYCMSEVKHLLNPYHKDICDRVFDILVLSTVGEIDRDSVGDLFKHMTHLQYGYVDNELIQSSDYYAVLTYLAGIYTLYHRTFSKWEASHMLNAIICDIPNVTQLEIDNIKIKQLDCVKNLLLNSLSQEQKECWLLVASI